MTIIAIPQIDHDFLGPSITGGRRFSQSPEEKLNVSCSRNDENFNSHSAFYKADVVQLAGPEGATAEAALPGTMRPPVD
jgi:hypothetical protein